MRLTVAREIKHHLISICVRLMRDWTRSFYRVERSRRMYLIVILNDLSTNSGEGSILSRISAMQKFTSLFYIHTYMHEAMSMKQITAIPFS